VGCAAPGRELPVSSRLVPQCGRPAWQISHIASTLAASGPAVRRPLQGTPLPLWTRVASDSSVCRVGHRLACAPGSDGGRAWTGVWPVGRRPAVSEGLAEAAGLRAGCHSSICMHLSVSLPYLYVCRMYLSVYACMCMYPQSFGEKNR
jgi:hypothetical protein